MSLCTFYTAHDVLRSSFIGARNCCGRCYLRFVGAREYAEYQNVTSLNLKCPACAGMLSNISGLVDDHIYPAVADYASKHQLNFTSFDLCLKLPPSLVLVRQKSIFF